MRISSMGYESSKRNHFHCVSPFMQNQIVENLYAKFPTYLRIIYVVPTFFIKNGFNLTCISPTLLYMLQALVHILTTSETQPQDVNKHCNIGWLFLYQ